MTLNLPESLLNLNANGGVFAVWLILRHYRIHMDVADIAKICRHDHEEGTFTIALAVALKKLGFEVAFYTDVDPNVSDQEQLSYSDAKVLNIPMAAALSYPQIQQAVDAGKFVIVFYDSLQGVGHQSLIYAIDHQHISFCDNFEPMSKTIFEQQRQAEGICRQVIVVEALVSQPF
ncbi:MAG: peptidase C39 [Acinetobacter sp.]|jgi:hypothetical protein|nr:MAG: peptidase C39 [Acinetobacter sp.]